MGRCFSALLFLVLAITLIAPPDAVASDADWPMWRRDANRSAASPRALPAELHLQWVREYPPLKPAWDEAVNQDRMTYDRVYEPVVIGSTMLIGSSRGDWVTALDTRSGRQKWRFYTDGPVRLPPVAHNGKGYFTSDDGYLYCVDAETGRLVWKFRGGPADRKVLGNGRLISAWPARGGPVICDGTVYFAAGIWPFMGTFVHALDAETGKAVWTNEGMGSMFIKQPHDAPSFGGIAPQGALAVIGDRLLVPGGRSVPGCLDRRTGQLRYFHLAGSPRGNMKLEGGSHLSAIGGVFFNHRGILTAMYDLDSGATITMLRRTTYPVLTDEMCYFSGNPLVACRLVKSDTVKPDIDKSDKKKRSRWALHESWKCDVDATGALIKAGNRLYAGGKGVISALDLQKDGADKDGADKVAWTAKVEGTVARLLAADGRLFAVTLEGRIYAFGPKQMKPQIFPTAVKDNTPSPAISELARRMLETTTLKRGYCLAFGLDSGLDGGLDGGQLVEAVVKNSELNVIAVDPDPEKVASLRRRFDAAGLYGTRISVHVGDATTFHAPPYLAVLTFSEKLAAHGRAADKAFIKSLFHSMRPYGGVAWLPVNNKTANNKTQRQSFERSVREAGLENARTRQVGNYIVLTRQGPLPGAGQWTHQYGNVANTSKSDDRIVRLPLGLLWFGGNTHDDILPRHGHGPPEQVIGGRLFVEGINSLSARDVYTGKRLWKREFEDLGTFGVYYDKTYRPDPLDTTYNQVHIPGANSRGTNYVVTRDKAYLIVGRECQVLDPATGKTLATFSLPKEPETKEKPAWGYIGVYKGLLIAGSQFVPFSKEYEVKTKSNELPPRTGVPRRKKSDPAAATSATKKSNELPHAKKTVWDNFDHTSSRKLVVMDRHSGKVLWTRAARFAFRHNAITAGGGKLFCIDSLPEPVLDSLRRRGKTPKGKARILALDIKTGQTVWTADKNVFGTWLSYDKQHDVLLESGRASADMIRGEPTGRMATYRGKTGAVVWSKPIKHGGPCMIHGKTIYLNAVWNKGAAVDLLTGKMKVRVNPITGRKIPWSYHRHYGCNSVNAGEHLLTFRSGAAGYYDLAGDGGTGNLGGFKSGCTSNLVIADGVLNAPDYTRTCTCTYQNQTSLAMVHTPGIETWTFNQFAVGKGRVKRIGINFGAPGDRRDPRGTLWLDYPSVGGASPDVPIKIVPVKTDLPPRFFRLHPLRVQGKGPAWVGASGLVGGGTVSIELGIEEPVAGFARIQPGSGNPPEFLRIQLPIPRYTVRLHFAEPNENLKPGGRVFDVALQGKTMLKAFDVLAQARKPRKTVVKQFTGVPIPSTLRITLTPRTDSPPILCGVEAVVEVAK